MRLRCLVVLLICWKLVAQSSRFEPLEAFLVCPDSEAIVAAESLATMTIPSGALSMAASPRAGAHLVRHVQGGGPDALIICPTIGGAKRLRTCLLSPVAPRGLDAFTLRAAGAPWLAQGFALVAPLRQAGQAFLIPDAGWIVAVERAIGLSPEGRVLLLGSPYSEWGLADAARFAHAIGGLHVGLQGDAFAPDVELTPPWIAHNWVIEYSTRLHPTQVRTLVRLGADVISSGATCERYPDHELDVRPAVDLKFASSMAKNSLAMPSTRPFRAEVRPEWQPLGRSGVLGRTSGYVGTISFENVGTPDFRLIQGPATPTESIELIIPILGEVTHDSLLSDEPPLVAPALTAVPESCRVEGLPWSPRVRALMTLRHRIRTGLPIKTLIAVRVST